MKKLIALVDDEKDILTIVSYHLKRAGFTVKQFGNARGLLEFLSHTVPDLIILDLMLPDEDGVEICKRLKSSPKYSSIPIIMLTAKGSETDIVLGLEVGADDYIIKPFSPRELVARVKAVLRRISKTGDEYIRIGKILEIDNRGYKVFVEGKEVNLTTTEFKILKILCEKKGWVYSREQILKSLWGEDKITLDRSVDVHIRNIRKKLDKASSFIKSIRGLGYKIEE